MSGVVRRLAVVLAFCSGLLGAAHGQTLALWFDDGLDPRTQPRAAEWNGAILDALAYAEVRAVLFAAGGRVDSPAGLSLVKAWGDAGHAVANHAYRHLDLAAATTTLDTFIADVERNDALLKDQPGWTPRLRFPYLKEGGTAAKRDGMRAWMTTHGYRSGAVSIDASDFWSLAKEAGMTALRYPAEDNVYEKPKLDALGL